MRVAEWTEYELIDCSDGERLERWGSGCDSYLLVRPDPQVLWSTPRTHPGWSKPDARYRRSGTGGGNWEDNALPERWRIVRNHLRFQIGLMNFKHVGLFPEQAVNWDTMTSLIERHGRPVNALNLFAYTGGATAALASAGDTQVCHVDAARGMVVWARENAALSGLSDRPIRWIVDDCVKFVERERRRGVRYDAIIMDPPSYGRGPGGEIWKLEERLFPFIQLTAELLSEHPCFFLVNSYTTGLSPSVMEYVLGSVLQKKYGGTVTSDELGLPVRESGLVLPCGSTAIWTP